MRIWMMLAVVGLGGCALFGRVEPGMDAAQVRDEVGAPGLSIEAPEGGRIWQYPTQPAGTTFRNVRFDAAGQVVEVWDGLDMAHLAQVQVGMSEAEVARRLGPYRTEVYFSLSGETVRDWNVDNTGNPGLATLFNVHFRDGQVVRTSTSYVYAEDVKFLGGLGGGLRLGAGF